MWLSFVGAVALLLLLLYAPGYLALRAFRLPHLLAVCCAPIVTVVLYNIAAIVCSFAGIFGSCATIAVPCLVLCALAAVVSFLVGGRLLRGESKSPFAGGDFAGKESWLQLACYLVVGIVITGYVLVGNLGSADSFFQAFDNVFHLNTVRSFIESGCCSVFDSRLYVREIVGDDAVPWVASGASSFYPTTWHLMTALAVDASGVGLTVAANALNACLAAVVFPAAVFVLLKVLFPRENGVVWLGSVCSVAFAVFPWDFLVFGPLYPNVFGNALLPIAMASFIGLFEAKDRTMLSLPARIGFFVVCVVALAFSHPNSVFSAVVLLTPFLCRCVSCWAGSAKLPGSEYVWKVCGYAVCLVAVGVIWMALYNTSFMQNGPLADWWPSYTRKYLGAKYVVSLALKEPAQWVLAVAVLFGVVRAVQSKEHRWLVVAYAAAAFIFWVDITTDGETKHILAGFWYTDSHRLAATIALAGIPLAALGLWQATCLVVRGVSALGIKAGDNKHAIPVCGFVLALVFCAGNYVVAGPSEEGSLPTAFGSIAAALKGQDVSQTDTIYNESEMDFMKQVEEIVPEGALIINQPNDGSAFACGIEGLNMYYRLLRGYGDDGELEQSKLIRHSLVDMASDDEVAQAVAFTGARYLLQLDAGDFARKNSPHLWTYEDPSWWEGVDFVDESTPGFKLVLAEGDMRLYEIGDPA
ncbi:DUF6541 family protein [Adlercreutzia sp. ZJ141]|uniref:DUF6541 family protein n=1 Tax=Adlercreutzia sp. ZJ141 TaxID=2709406 RepID=UPI0013EAD0CA|nr:DUF6541 family protein [Adlercreutzia sp. ZJ141]